jgi:hypothetical protein
MNVTHKKFNKYIRFIRQGVLRETKRKCQNFTREINATNTNFH